MTQSLQLMLSRLYLFPDLLMNIRNPMKGCSPWALRRCKLLRTCSLSIPTRFLRGDEQASPFQDDSEPAEKALAKGHTCQNNEPPQDELAADSVVGVRSAYHAA